MNKYPFENCELLAPAGGKEQLYSAVRCGADAVYLGASSFNARSSAENFTDTSLKECVDYCHLHSVKVYLTLNTLVKNSELSEVMKVVEMACSIPVDAILVQDLGLAKLISKCAPNMRLHASTQMSVHSAEGVKFLESLGFKRVVLSRELSIKEIKEIRKATSVELEVFVHGALCMSVSGQCLMSSVFGCRSGNRGECAQPCRLPFSSTGCNDTDHVLSLKDNCAVDILTELAEAGVNSFKIEGRMKRPEYVAAAVSAYRHVMDTGETNKESFEDLQKVFSRSGFTEGYLDGKIDKDMLGTRTKEDVTSASSSLFKKLQGLYHKETMTNKVDFYCELVVGKQSKLTAVYGEMNLTTEVFGAQVQEGEHDIDKERVISQLKKSGGTSFVVENVELAGDEKAYVPASALNAMRRQALEILEKAKIKEKSKPVPFARYPISRYQGSNIPTKRVAIFNNLSQIPTDDTLSYFSTVFIPLTFSDEEFLMLSKKVRVGVYLPRSVFGRENMLFSRLKALKAIGIETAMCNNIGEINIIKDADMSIYFGFSMNVLNNEAYKFLSTVDAVVEAVTLSLEIDVRDSYSFGGKVPTAVVVYGRIPLMLTRNCPSSKSCKECNHHNKITDRKGISFDVRCDGGIPGCGEILNSVPLYMGERISEISANHIVFMFSTENQNQVEKVVADFKAQRHLENNITRGLYYRKLI